MTVFKIHASQIGKIMGGSLTKPTEKQLRLLDTLNKKVKLTANQVETRDSIIALTESKPSLQDGAKTYCKNWLKEQEELYNRTRDFSNKYTLKGEICEPEGIRLTARMMGYGEVFKNEKQYENEYIIGTPDLVLNEIVEDIKCSWNEQTFPLFDTELPQKDYWWQGLGYLDLTHKKKYAVNYCLIDAPTEIIDKAASYRARQLGMAEVDMDLYDFVAADMTYTNIPDSLKFKRFPFDRDDKAIKAIHTQVELCRNYIEQLRRDIIKMKSQYLVTA